MLITVKFMRFINQTLKINILKIQSGGRARCVSAASAFDSEITDFQPQIENLHGKILH